MGHATRCIPVVNVLLERGWNVVLAADRAPLALLQEAFPQLEAIRLPGARMIYPRRGSALLHIAWQVPGFLHSIRREHRDLAALLRQRSFDLVVSDNRYGLWHPSLPSVLISHQLRLRAPGLPPLEAGLRRFVRYHAAHFQEIWVPDHEGPDNLSGALSDPSGLPVPVRFVGPLSRFADAEAAWPSEPVSGGLADLRQAAPFDLLLMVSGPEPAASEFRRRLRDQALRCGLKALMVEGQPGRPLELAREANLWRIPHLPSPWLAPILSQQPLVVCRSGYSTLMDLAVYGARALLVPTPGQSEQEYLARRFAEKGWSHSVSQSRMDLERDLPAVRKASGIRAGFSSAAMHAALDELAIPEAR
jgi:UDP:flavonoid glycosyltransferase YjiC (YdhE family)